MMLRLSDISMHNIAQHKRVSKLTAYVRTTLGIDK